jgi:3-hydroxyisobutyrate dehydrogenase
MTSEPAVSSPSVAVLGTGTMGAPMAANIARAGMALRVWNRTAAKSATLSAFGATVCGTPAEAVTSAGVVLTMLFDADAVAAVMGGEGGALSAMAPDAVWLQCSTVGAAGCERLAELAEEARVGFVDAPVLGSRQPAEAGQLVVLASGPDELRGHCQPVLDAVGGRVHWVGPAGSGSRLKLVANNWLVTVADGVAESVVLARRFGLDPQLFFDAIAGSAVDCAYAQLKGKAMVAGDFVPSFPLRAAAKDSRLVMEATEELLVDLRVARAVCQDLSYALDLGHGDEDLAAVYYAHH